MAHNPIPRPESSDAPKSKGAPAADESGRRLEPEAASQLLRWQGILNAHGGASVSADLALDLVLNEIAEVTRESTHASAAAIALARDGEIVCRATTGDGAPELGARLSGDTGLSAACVKTGNWQRCDDSENDARVDPQLCRGLGVRSIVAVPVRQAGELLGVLEIFSAKAAAFGEREVRTLQMLSRSIVENIELARRASRRDDTELRGEVVAGSREFPPESGGEEISARETEAAIHPQVEGRATADWWTGALMVAVVVLAVTLGWMVGRGRRGAKANLPRQATPGLQSAEATSRTGTQAGKLPLAAASSGGGSSSGLVVYQDGKIVFPQTPPIREAQSRDSRAAPELRPAAETSKVQTDGPERIASGVAAGWVTQRVEPEYPEHARTERIQGAVALDAVIDKDGTVRKFMAIRGDPELAAAASAAVRQWRFRPLVRDGQGEEFQTQITVTFRLP
jgi:TonB family protein